MSNVQKFLANEGGIHKRRLDVRPIPSANCLRESVLPMLLRPDFSFADPTPRSGFTLRR